MKKLDDQIDLLKEKLKSIKQEISKTKSFLTGNVGDRSKDILLDELENLALKKEEIEDEIKLCEKEKKHLARQTSINISTYKKILKYFIAEWKNGNNKKREHIVKR